MNPGERHQAANTTRTCNASVVKEMLGFSHGSKSDSMLQQSVRKSVFPTITLIKQSANKVNGTSCLTSVRALQNQENTVIKFAHLIHLLGKVFPRGDMCAEFARFCFVPET